MSEKNKCRAIVEESRNKNFITLCEEENLDLQMLRKLQAEFDNFSEQVNEGKE